MGLRREKCKCKGMAGESLPRSLFEDCTELIPSHVWKPKALITPRDVLTRDGAGNILRG